MRFLVFLLLVTAVITAAHESESVESTQVCEPGRVFSDYCNTCKCSDDGTSASCTRMFCPPGFFNKDGSTRIPLTDLNLSTIMHNVVRETMTCEPRKFFKKYCNTCRCSEEGTSAICTYLECPPDVYNEDGSVKDDSFPNVDNSDNSHVSDVQSIMCQPGKVFKKDCNSCLCSKDGKTAACTYLDCSAGLYKVDASRNDDSEDSSEQRDTINRKMMCQPGRVFKSACNSCKCSEDGQSAECTFMLCPPGYVNEHVSGSDFKNFLEKRQSKSVKMTCEPGKLFKKSCNTCHCDDDGQTAACTIMLCPPDYFDLDFENFLAKYESKSVKMTCEPGRTFKESCNTCKCSKDGQTAACTIMLCPPDYVDSDFENFLAKYESKGVKMMCEPGRFFKESCNTCQCSKDGQTAACTFMDCPPDYVDSDFENFLAKYEKKSVKMMCEPGRFFKESCNTCQCSKDGQTAACTFMVCPPGYVDENGSGSEVSDADFERFLGRRETMSIKMTCKPGKLFKESCNTCRCEENGQSAACTRMDCPPGYVNEYPSTGPVYSSRNVASDSDIESLKTCEPGKVTKQSCTCSCHCGKNGQAATCTLGDYPSDYVDSDFENFFAKYESKSVNMSCEPGKVFMESCNCNCNCGKHGQAAACTLTDSPPDYVDSDFENFLMNYESKSIKKTCEPGRIFKESCNTCKCSKDGQTAACTFMVCPPDYFDLDFENFLLKYESKSVKKTCEPGRIFKESCNTCKCSKDGQMAACTFMVCPPTLDNEHVAMRIQDDSEFSCKAGETFQQACNTCFCSDDGRSAACTRMDCDF